MSRPVTARTPRTAKVSDRSRQSATSSVRGGTRTRPRPMARASAVDRTNGAASTSPMAIAFGTSPWRESVWTGMATRSMPVPTLARRSPSRSPAIRRSRSTSR
ncbi:hypothetical protein [Amycolatopsis sp. DG1A-15b]|uniref:hypothetical protein n=1 Tax=Amycolatopsis sp. DG1A-15b TaxID=3052846 RepID=UPI00255BA5F8|nr:hypothetical protein [Amycolatopsis sp. DG1A-15b]WIX89274.1 hypothetical protein QRY02_02145 [Amycolatopsis sp. DG1A-15b]